MPRGASVIGEFAIVHIQGKAGIFTDQLIKPCVGQADCVA